jgi:hypothetical protein
MKSFTLAALLIAAMATITHGFSSTTTSQHSRPTTTTTSLESTPAPLSDTGSTTPPDTGSTTPPLSTAGAAAVKVPQSQYGKDETPLPETYAQCGRCQSAFGLTEADLGEGGRGRYDFCLLLLLVCCYVMCVTDSNNVLTVCLFVVVTAVWNAVCVDTLGFNRKTVS